MARGLLVVALAVSLARLAAASTATDLCPATADPCSVSGAVTVQPGSVLDFGTRQLDITPTGSITIPSGQLTIRAGSVRLETHGQLVGGQTSDDSGANVSITTTGDVRVETGASGDAKINMSASFNPGEIDIVAGGAVYVLGQVHADGTNSQGCGGTINITSTGAATISGLVSAQGGTGGDGGAVTIQGGTASVSGNVRANGGCGGDIEIDALAGDLTSGGTLDGSANASSGDGGDVTLTATGNTTMSGQVLLGGTGDLTDGGGDGGCADLEATGGSLSVGGTVDTHGAAPDGCAGETDMTAGVDYTQAGTVNGHGNGGSGGGGFFDAEISRNASVLGTIDEGGGFYGGDILIDAAAASLGSASVLSGDGGTDGGSVTINAQTISSAGKVHAIASASTSTGGLIQLTGCTLNVPSGALVRTDAASGGENLLQASGQLTIGGTVQARPSGENRFEYRDPTKPPITLGTAIISPTPDCAPAAGCLNPNLVACAAVSVCGNGIVEPGEQCDDGNTVSCDGCSSTCQLEYCGDGRIECGKECDDGAANGAPGDPCDATCHIVHNTNVVFVPGLHRGRNGCALEWAITNAPMSGFPDRTQSCTDADPACDADGLNDGACTFHVTACLNVPDARLPGCVKRIMNYAKVRRPSPLDPRDAVEAANAQQLVTALEGLGLTVRAGDTVLQAGSPDSTTNHCTQPFTQRVPHGTGVSARRLLSAGVTDVTGVHASNRMALKCLPNPAVCGNGIVELGEECDDGNTADCDGCDHNCKIERCGNGFVQCHEQCDDGPNNGTPGDPCTTSCTWAPPTDRIPGATGSRGCIGEFALATDHLAAGRNGLPSNGQICVDGDPSCDFDPTPGSCRFHLWLCFGGDDARLACAADTVTSVDLVRPSATQIGFSAAARTAIDAALGQMKFPVGPGEACSGRVDLDVPAGRTKLLVKEQPTTIEGIRARGNLKLTCAPAGTVLR